MFVENNCIYSKMRDVMLKNEQREREVQNEKGSADIDDSCSTHIEESVQAIQY